MTPIFEAEVAGYKLAILKSPKPKDMRYSVEYGDQLIPDLALNEAIRQFGHCLRHALELEGKVDTND